MAVLFERLQSPAADFGVPRLLVVPEFVARVREQFASEIAAKEKTIIPGDEVDIDFTLSTIGWRGERFTFPALGSVPQSLVIAGGVENLVAQKLESVGV